MGRSEVSWWVKINVVGVASAVAMGCVGNPAPVEPELPPPPPEACNKCLMHKHFYDPKKLK